MVAAAVTTLLGGGFGPWGLGFAPVVVVPALVATGSVSQVTLKRDLEGLPVIYAGDAVLPNQGMARWVERVATAALATP